LCSFRGAGQELCSFRGAGQELCSFRGRSCVRLGAVRDRNCVDLGAEAVHRSCVHLGPLGGSCVHLGAGAVFI
jgi:hypothetical protein